MKTFSRDDGEYRDRAKASARPFGLLDETGLCCVPVVDADVRWTVFRRPHYVYWRCWAYYYDWYMEDGDDDEEFDGRRERHRGMRHWGGPGEQILQGSGRSDKDGRVEGEGEVSP